MITFNLLVVSSNNLFPLEDQPIWFVATTINALCVWVCAHV